MLALADAAAEAIEGVVSQGPPGGRGALRIAAAPEGAPEGSGRAPGVRQE
jgi:hypothetical protein